MITIIYTICCMVFDFLYFFILIRVKFIIQIKKTPIYRLKHRNALHALFQIPYCMILNGGDS
jgi:hypothetical protein